VVLERPDLWDDPVFAGKVSREHGELMGKIKSVNQFEQELMEHIDMLRLAREEDDNELETVSAVLPCTTSHKVTTSRCKSAICFYLIINILCRKP
jgi:hypothetical protein